MIISTLINRTYLRSSYDIHHCLTWRLPTVVVITENLIDEDNVEKTGSLSMLFLANNSIVPICSNLYCRMNIRVVIHMRVPYLFQTDQFLSLKGKTKELFEGPVTMLLKLRVRLGSYCRQVL